MLFVRYIWIQECFPGQGGPIDREVREPSVEQIMKAISQLDGDISSYMTTSVATEAVRLLL